MQALSGDIDMVECGIRGTGSVEPLEGSVSISYECDVPPELCPLRRAGFFSKPPQRHSPFPGDADKRDAAVNRAASRAAAGIKILCEAALRIKR